MSTRTADPVLASPPPSFGEDAATDIARAVFGVGGRAKRLASERDQAFLIDGDRPAIMKVSNVAEDPARLDMEALAAQRVASVAPELPVALPWAVPSAAAAPGDPAAFRATIDGPDGAHHVRMYDRLPGRASVAPLTLADDAVRAWGSMAARVGRGLRGFAHASSMRVMLWDPQHALRLRELLHTVPDGDARALVARTLDRFEQVVAPAWPSLRAQVIHGDLSPDNVLVDDRGTVTGIIDFGDMGFSALVADPAAVVESLVMGRSDDDVFRTTRIVLDGYERVTPLEPDELAIFFEVVAARACASVVVPASRASLYGGRAPMAGLSRRAVTLLRTLDAVGFDEAARRIGGREPGTGSQIETLVERRHRLLGPALTPLTYDEPLHLVRGEGVWLYDADGRRYLDAYNNVPVVGHAHPRVTEAIARQGRRLNTNLRYLHATALEVAERLVATTGPGLDVVMFVNSGSEANDLAWRIATSLTGRTGGICTAYAYHGVTDAITALSPEAWGDRPRPPHVRTWTPPDGRSPVDPVAEARRGIEELVAAGHPPAASILDAVLTSDGILDLAPDVVREVVRLTREVGALWIADEVQGGHGRTGAMWSYERYGIEPDLVTLGKPMGNGHPVAAVIARRDVAQRFADTTDFFSTFGGNPVAMAAALAVLDVIEDERILDGARETGDELRAALRDLRRRFPAIADVRGVGLATGVEIVDPETSRPAAAATRGIVNGLRRNGVLVGTTGRAGNVLKIRPPLVFRRQHADLLVSTLGKVLSEAL